MNAPTSDPVTLWQARLIVRQAYVEIRALRQADPTIRCVAHQLDDIACDITVELEAIGPMLPLSRVA